MYAGTTTGDFIVVTSKDRKLRRTIGPACKLGVHSMLCFDGGKDVYVELCYIEKGHKTQGSPRSDDRKEVSHKCTAPLHAPPLCSKSRL